MQATTLVGVIDPNKCPEGIVKSLTNIGFDLDSVVEEFEHPNGLLCFLQGDAQPDWLQQWKRKGRRQFCFKNGVSSGAIGQCPHGYREAGTNETCPSCGAVVPGPDVS